MIARLTGCKEPKRRMSQLRVLASKLQIRDDARLLIGHFSDSMLCGEDEDTTHSTRARSAPCTSPLKDEAVRSNTSLASTEESVTNAVKVGKREL